MEISEFTSIINEAKKNKPILFGLDSDKVASDNEIKQVEEYYGVELPQSYKEFVKKFGGGFFGFTVVYSCDCSSKFYVVNNVLKEWIDIRNFFPVIDFETGDLCGFQVEDSKCKNLVSVFDHEENRVIDENKCDFFQALLEYGLKL